MTTHPVENEMYSAVIESPRDSQVGRGRRAGARSPLLCLRVDISIPDRMPNRRTVVAPSRNPGVGRLFASAAGQRASSRRFEKAKGPPRQQTDVAGGDTCAARRSPGVFVLHRAGVNGGGSTLAISKAPTRPLPAGRSETQKGRDGVRRRCSRTSLLPRKVAHGDARLRGRRPGSCPRSADAEKYRARIARLRQSLVVHERNIEALKKELAAVR